MSNIIDRYIDDDGEIYTKVVVGANNVNTYYGTNNKYLIPIYHDDTVVEIVAGNPIGLLLSLTYSATP